MANFLKKLRDGSRQYSLLDFAMLKIAMLCVGILLGIYFSNFFSTLLPAIWIVGGFCLLTIIVVTLTKSFGKAKREKRKK